MAPNVVAYLGTALSAVFAPQQGAVTAVTKENRSRFAGFVPNRILPHLQAYVPSLRVGERNRVERRRIQRWLLRMQRRRSLAYV